MTDESKLLLTKMLDDAVEKIDYSMEYIYNESEKLIKLATECELPEKAKEIKEIKELEKFKNTSKNAKIHSY